MDTVTQVCETLQIVLNEEARQAGRESGFIRRERKLSGASFVQTLVFGWMANPQASLEELSQAAATCGTEISAQGLAERFTESAAACVRQVLEASLTYAVEAAGGSVAALARFKGVYLQDSTVIALPASLASVWRGCGNQSGNSAGLKVQTVFEYQSGRLRLSLHAASAHDSPLQTIALPQGALRLADTGYFHARSFERLNEGQVYWLTRVPAHVQVWENEGRARPLVEWLEQHTVNGQCACACACACDASVCLTGQKLACRLLAQRVTPAVAQQRREQAQAEAQRRGRSVSPGAWALCEWTVMATNLSVAQLSLAEALTLLRLRWQIELLFKLWKSHVVFKEWRSQQPWRILCEVYGKLLMVVVQHWLLLLACWDVPDRSLVKASQTLRKHAFHLAAVLFDLPRLRLALQLICRTVSRCRLNKRQAHPATFQRLMSLGCP